MLCSSFHLFRFWKKKTKHIHVWIACNFLFLFLHSHSTFSLLPPSSLSLHLMIDLSLSLSAFSITLVLFILPFFFTTLYQHFPSCSPLSPLPSSITSLSSHSHFLWLAVSTLRTVLSPLFSDDFLFCPDTRQRLANLPIH